MQCNLQYIGRNEKHRKPICDKPHCDHHKSIAQNPSGCRPLSFSPTVKGHQRCQRQHSQTVRRPDQRPPGGHGCAETAGPLQQNSKRNRPYALCSGGSCCQKRLRAMQNSHHAYQAGSRHYVHAPQQRQRSKENCRTIRITDPTDAEYG